MFKKKLKEFKTLILNTLNKQIKFNYFFYIPFFLIISILSVFKTNLFFIFYVIVQSAVFTLIIIFFKNFLKKSIFKNAITIFSIFFLILYLANYILISLMNINILFAIKIFSSGGFYNFLILLRAMDINLKMGFIIISILFITPMLSILIYKYTNFLSNKKKLSIKNYKILSVFCILLISLFLLDIFNNSKNNEILKNKTDLPLAFSFIKEKKDKLILDNSFI
ncbi:MAG: hypothetical protein K1060chlam5_00790, partial [Candidatus Anoxychlamydiales bacterium]|nr:hypothetical protein [Candidatus Anoxychlamydiales bacterium]